MESGMASVRAFGLIAFLAASLSAGNSLPETAPSESWNTKKAAAYLDQREQWWSAWPVAARDHGTFCVSCHTTLPYAMARPALRAALHEDGPSPGEQKLLENVTRRVRFWKNVEPFYGDVHTNIQKANESRGTESVLDALTLLSYDAGNGNLSDDTRAALDHMWTLQQTAGDRKGAWQWLQFGNEPFEANDSDYYGAALAAVAAGIAGTDYRAMPGIRNNLESLRNYLNRECARQSPINRVVLLWASAKWPGLISPRQQNAITREIFNRQETDGGWNLAPLAWSWRDWTMRSLVKTFTRSYGTDLIGVSDGYATALITYVLEQTSRGREDERLGHARAWLVHHQNEAHGFWRSYSLNNQRDPSSGTGLFMSDAATAYAVLALTAPYKQR